MSTKNRTPFISDKLLDLCVLREERHLENCLRWLNDQLINLWLLAGSFPLEWLREKEWFDLRGKDKENVALAIETKDDKHIGNIGLHKINWVSGLAEIGIVIGDKDEWGKGYGSEAERMIIDYAFSSLNLRKIYGQAFAQNLGSIKALEKNDFQEEARLKKHYYKNGEYQTIVVMSLFREDWQKTK